MSQSPLFSIGLEVANFVIASDVLRRSWSTIRELYREINGTSLPFSIRFKLDVQNPNYNTIAFVTSPPCARENLQGEGVADMVPLSTLKGTFPLFEFLCTKNYSDFSIHKQAIQLFDEFRGTQLDKLWSQISNSKPLLVTGHGLGGSVAALFTLWLLEKMDLTKPNRPLCVTFGSPLIGDEGLQEAIQYSTWNSYFLHVVSVKDPLPRSALISPNISPTEYKPFGTFLFCSERGRCASFQDSKSILKLLKAIYSEVPGNQNPNQGSQFFDYEEVVRQLHRNEICKVLEPDTQHQWLTLLSETERQERQAAIWKRQVFDPSKKLNEVKINMACLEWYKKVHSKETGYYDSYKDGTNTGDIDVVKYKRILKCYWEDLVDEVDKKPQKEGAAFRTRWLFAGTNYRRMVEPLDIADYYKSGRSDYMEKGRSKHYKLLEQWYNEDKKAASDPLSKKANVKASLNDDSCFWARVEEARISCKLLSNEYSSVSTKKYHEANLIKFEAYVLGMLKNYAVTPEIFLSKCSFMQWWIEYEKIMGTAYTSSLKDLMRNDRYSEYASGKLLIP